MATSSNAEEETEEPQLTEEEKLEKLHKLVDLFPDFLALVTEVDKRINDEIFEYYKTPDQITLQVNDLYCKRVKATTQVARLDHTY